MNQEKILQSFAPVAADSCRILILGTMPGAVSLVRQEYYAHRQNQFWQIMFTLLNQSLTDDYNHKQQLLLQNRIALWDVLKHCRRNGSSDLAIKDPEANDFARFYRQHGQIEAVFFNGGKAEQLYRRLVLNKTGQDGKKLVRLPSTSPANTRPLAEKLHEWQAILAWLE